MDIEKTLTREQLLNVLDRLKAIVEQSDKAEPICLDDLRIEIPNTFTCELEYEEEDGQAELELEISWCKSNIISSGATNATTHPDSNDTPSPGRYDLFKGKDGQWYFHLKADNGRIILASEGYHNKQGAENGIASVRANAQPEHFEIRRSKSHQPYFVLKAKNGAIIGVSQMYRRMTGCKKGIRSVVRHCGAGVVTLL